MCSNNCFLLEQFLIVAACPGAPGQGHSPLFESRGSPFFNHLLELFFSLKIVIFYKRPFQNGITMRSCGAYFLEKMQKRKSVFRLRRRVRIACVTIPWSVQGDPKIKEKTWHSSEPTFLDKKYKNIAKNNPKRCPKGWPDFRGGGLGGALDGLWRPNLLLNTKSIPKVLQKWLQGCKNYTKRPGGLRGAIKLNAIRTLQWFDEAIVRA